MDISTTILGRARHASQVSARVIIEEQDGRPMAKLLQDALATAKHNGTGVTQEAIAEAAQSSFHSSTMQDRAVNMATRALTSRTVQLINSKDDCGVVNGQSDCINCTKCLEGVPDIEDFAKILPDADVDTIDKKSNVSII